MEDSYYIIIRNLAFIFSTLMLLKYFIFLIVAPFYPIKELLRQIKISRSNQAENYPLISIIIPAWNEEVGIIKTLKSIEKNEYKNYEIIIVDDGSTDNTASIVNNYLISRQKNETISECFYFRKTNQGKGEALNFGLNKTKGEIILTIDADTVVSRNSLKNLVKYYRDPKIDAVVGNVKVANNFSTIGFIQQLEYFFGFYFKRAHAVLGAEYIFGGACASFRKKVFQVVGNFDTTNKTEDIEMTLRIRAHGFNCTYAEDVICYTEGADTITGLLNQRLRWKKGRLDTFFKYRWMFFSTEKRHNKFLTFFILPFSVLGELQLLIEPLAISLLGAYSFLSGDYLSFSLGLMFLFIIYFVAAFFTDEGLNLKMIFFYLISWPLFYFLVWIEFVSLLQSLKVIISGKEIAWQNWQRKGVGVKL